jgi:hypothetical protein
MERQNLRGFPIICLSNRRKLDSFEIGKLPPLLTGVDNQVSISPFFPGAPNIFPSRSIAHYAYGQAAIIFSDHLLLSGFQR